jgi:hypothetical protein
MADLENKESSIVNPEVTSNPVPDQQESNIPSNSIEPNTQEFPKEETFDYSDSDRVTSPNVILTTGEGKKIGFNSQEYQKNQVGTDSQSSHFASADYHIEPLTPTPAQPNQERATEEMRNIFEIDTKHEKPTEIIKDIRKYPAYDGEESEEKYKKDREKLDDADRRAIKQNDQGVYFEAEMVKINQHLKEYDENLRKGRELNENEVNFLRDQYLNRLPRYEEFKASYEAKNLTEEDKKILLSAHFANEISEFEKSLKTPEGKYSSINCNLKQLGALYDMHEKELIRAHVQDRRSRQQSSEDENRLKREEEYKKQFEETYGIPWSVEAAKLMQERDILKTERNLFKEDKAKNLNGDEAEKTDETVIPTEIEDTEKTDPNKERKERNFKRVLLIGGVVSGVTTGLLVTSATIPPIGAALIASNALTAGSDFVLKLSGQSLLKKITSENDPERKHKLEKRLEKINKIRNAISYIKPFIRGATLGFAGSVLFRNIFLGGQSVLEKMASTSSGEGASSNLGTLNNEGSTNQNMGESLPSTPSEEQVVTSGSQEGVGVEQIPTDMSAGQPEAWMTGDSFKASDLGWDYNKLGWLGDNVSISAKGGRYGLLQKDFFGKLFESVPLEYLRGPEAAKIVNSSLIDAYNGANPIEAASQAAQLILGQ